MSNPETPTVERGPCSLHDHFGEGECPDCAVRRKLAEAEGECERLREEHAKYSTLVDPSAQEQR